MDGWMDGMDGWMDGMDGLMDGMECMEWMDGCDEWMGGWTSSHETVLLYMYLVGTHGWSMDHKAAP